MKNATYRQMTSDPESLIQVKEPLPQVGPGDVLVRICATALNARDLSVMRGR
jgi:NADPH:quinone reductase-like Zn-dependent oxidoreductase